MPGQELVDPVDRVVGDAGEHVAQVGLRIEAVQGRGLDERVENRSPTTTGVRAGKEVVLAAQRERADGTAVMTRTAIRATLSP
jgi:hypothetical protein